MAHLSLVTLGVDDLPRAIRFYESLGWHRSGASAEDVVAFLEGGAVVLALFGRADLADDARVEPDPSGGHGSIALAMNVESPAMVDATLKVAADAGGQITKPADRADWGGYSGYFRDPDGHLWEVTHNPHFGLAADGRVVLPGSE